MIRMHVVYVHTPGMRVHGCPDCTTSDTAGLLELRQLDSETVKHLISAGALCRDRIAIPFAVKPMDAFSKNVTSMPRDILSRVQQHTETSVRSLSAAG